MIDGDESPLAQNARWQPRSVEPTFPQLYALRAQLAAIGEKVRHQLAAKRRILSVPAHTDDIVAMYRERIDSAASDYEARLTGYLVAPAAGELPSLIGDGAAEYFMRDLMASKAPDVVKRLVPEASRGMRSADRLAALAPIDAELNVLLREHQTVLAAMQKQHFHLKEEWLEARRYDNTIVRCAIETQLLDLPGELETATRAEEELVRRIAEQGPR